MVLSRVSESDFAAIAACVREIQIHFSPLFNIHPLVDCFTLSHAHMPRLPHRGRASRLADRADILSAASAGGTVAGQTALTPHDRQSSGRRP